MIIKINKIKNFGIFKDFTWTNNLSEFKKFNLLYGWNGSGKTTFSKLFTMIEQKNDTNLLKNLLNYEFTFTKDDSNILNQNNYKTNNLNLYVYNEIFKENNMDWNNVIKSILLISNNVITEKTQLDAKKLKLGHEDKQDTILGSIKKNTVDKVTISDSIDKFYSQSAKKIKEEFKVIDTSDTYYFNYNKTKFSSFVDANISKIQNISNKLETESVSKLKESIKPNILNKIILDFKKIDLAWLEQVQEKVLNILKTSLVVREVERLKEHPKIGKWVENGIEIHKFYNSSKCEFCNQDLPQERLEDLEKHFSEEFKKLKEKIELAISWLPQQKISYDALDSEIEFYPEYQDESKVTKKDIKDSIKVINKLFDIWLKSLEQKKENPFEIIENIQSINTDELSKYNILKEKLTTLINKHNNKTENFEIESQTLKSKLELHYATTYYHEFELKKKIKSIQKIDENLQINNARRRDLEKEIKLLEARLSDEAFGAKEFNKKLHKFLGRNNISLEFDQTNKGYKIIRDGERAANLSEGEKTAISFVYFVTKIKENENKIEDSIIVVDDPISSFDSNNLFSAYSFLKNECEQAKQLFVITHNFAYFKLIRDWFLNKNKKKDTSGSLIIKSNCYSIETKIDNQIRSSSIENANTSLTKYQSEYHFIFFKIYTFKNENINEDNAYLIGNLLRKLLESFLSFKYPKKRNDFKQLCEVAISDKQLNEKIYRFINKYSHNQTIEFFDSGDDTVLSESNAIINDVLEKVIKTIDKRHYEEMEKVVLENIA